TKVRHRLCLPARGTGGFAISAGQAAVNVLLCAVRRLAAFQQAFDEIDASAWTIQLVAQHLIGGAGGVAKAAVDAATQYAFGFVGAGQLFCLLTEMGLHGGFYRSAYMRPGLNMPWGSTCVFSR